MVSTSGSSGMAGTGSVVIAIAAYRHRTAEGMAQVGPGQRAGAVAIGVIRTPPSSLIHERLAEIHGEMESLLSQFKPDAVAIEQVFFQNNVRTAMGVGQASGIVLALASRAGCAVAQYTPSQVKNTIVGWGSATKDQIGHMVQQRLNLATIPQPADAADAAAIALCHCSIAPFIASRDAAIARSAR